MSMMKKPTIDEQFADNGELSHYHLIDSETGEVLWSSFPAETIARGQKIAFFSTEDAMKVIKAWESLKGGIRYSPSQIEEWMATKMAPAINKLRKKLKN